MSVRVPSLSPAVLSPTANGPQEARLAQTERPTSIASSTGTNPNYENREIIANADGSGEAHELTVRFGDGAGSRDSQFREVFSFPSVLLIIVIVFVHCLLQYYITSFVMYFLSFNPTDFRTLSLQLLYMYRRLCYFS